MLDICFNGSVGGNLMVARTHLESDGVLPLNLHLNYGKLSGDVIATQERISADTFRNFYPDSTPEEVEKEYKKGLRQARRCFKDLAQRLESGQSIRVWVSNTAHDRCNLYWLCHFAKDFPTKLFVVVCPGYEFDTRKQCYIENRNWARFSNAHFMADCANKAIELTEEEIQAYANEWNKLVEKDAPLRILIDDNLINVEEDFFDSIILRHIENAPKSQSSILGNVLAEGWGMDVDFICARIDFLLKSNVIKICEKRSDDYGGCWPRTIAKV